MISKPFLAGVAALAGLSLSACTTSDHTPAHEAGQGAPSTMSGVAPGGMMFPAYSGTQTGSAAQFAPGGGAAVSVPAPQANVTGSAGIPQFQGGAQRMRSAE